MWLRVNGFLKEFRFERIEVLDLQVGEISGSLGFDPFPTCRKGAKAPGFSHCLVCAEPHKAQRLLLRGGVKGKERKQRGYF